MRFKLKFANKWVRAGVMAIGLLAAVVYAGVWPPKPAQAAACGSGPAAAYGRNAFCGYFSNVYDDGLTGNGGGFVIPGGGVADIPPSVNSAASYVSFFKGLLGGSLGAQGKVGAEFVIETMLGHAGGSHTRAQANVGTADYNEWASLITQYAAAGDIDWNLSYNVTNATLNSFYQANGENDDAFCYGCGQNGSTDTIAFYSSPAHTKMLYDIRRACGNPLGNLIGLTALVLPYKLTLTLVPGAGTPAYTTGPGTGIVEPGVTYHLTPTVVNPSANDATALNMEVENLSSAYLTNGGISGGGADVTGDSYMAAGCTSKVSPCWHWDYANGLKKDTTSTNTDGVTFKVAASTPQGTKVCFEGWISPSTQVAGSVLTTAKDCFLVYTPVLPSVVGNNGDVHAGGGLCDAATLLNGYVQGYTGAGSGGEYIVSAQGTIDGFGSDGSTTSGTTLNVGQNGAYSQVCREDLLSAAVAYKNAGGVVSGGIWAGGTHNISGLSGLYYATGNITIFGTVDSKMTIVALSGNVTIDGAGGIELSAASAPIDQLPSLGIIASGDIDIDSSVTLVDAYLFADGDINTCLEANKTCATAPLVVNGFLMGKSINFQRLGAAAAKGATQGEVINLNPQIYLNPPQFFDATVDDILLEGQGEAPPRF